MRPLHHPLATGHIDLEGAGQQHRGPHSETRGAFLELRAAAVKMPLRWMAQSIATGEDETRLD